jgi:hypothetical protein
VFIYHLGSIDILRARRLQGVLLLRHAFARRHDPGDQRRFELIRAETGAQPGDVLCRPADVQPVDNPKNPDAW